MIIMNAIGMIVFISNFNGVFIFQDLESSRQIQKMSVLSQKCLPLLQDGGLNKAENMKKLSDIILKETPLTVSQMKACDTEQIPDLRADCIAQKFQDLLLQYREEMTVDTAVTDRYSFRSAYPNSLIQFYQE